MTTTVPAPLEALTRHFIDLRDGNHFGHISRSGKESAFTEVVNLLDSPARRVLAEFNEHLLARTGKIEITGLHRDTRGGLIASWLLTWPEQRARGLAPISLIASYGAGFHYPRSDDRRMAAQCRRT